jgi:hypothetical protein
LSDNGIFSIDPATHQAVIEAEHPGDVYSGF